MQTVISVCRARSAAEREARSQKPSPSAGKAPGRSESIARTQKGGLKNAAFLRGADPHPIRASWKNGRVMRPFFVASYSSSFVTDVGSSLERKR